MFLCPHKGMYTCSISTLQMSYYYLLTTSSIIRLLKRKVRELPRACPDLPTDYSSNTLPHSFSRHSIGKILYFLMYMYMYTGT